VVIKSLKACLTSGRGTRALALVLLAAIAWGATAEVTHHHGTSSRSAGLPTASQDQSESQRVEAPEPEKTSRRAATRDECLICQLHQNLFATSFTHAPQSAPVESRLVHSQLTEISYFSRFHTQQQGRAPPSIL